MKVDDIEFTEVRKTLLIAADCTDSDRGPRLQARIQGARRSAVLNGIVADLMPFIHMDIPLPVTDWRDLVGISISDESHTETGWQFAAWCTLLQYSDLERYSLRILSRDHHQFLVEADADVTIHDLSDDPYTAHFRALTTLAFEGIEIRVPKSSRSPTVDAGAILKTFHDASSLAPPIVNGWYYDPKNPSRGAFTNPQGGDLVCYEASYRPL